MWTVIKFDRKKFHFFKKEIQGKLSKKNFLYYPKLLVHKYKNNKLIKKEYNMLGDYVFCYDKELQNDEILAKLKFVRGLKYILSGSLSAQTEIKKFIETCKEFENKNGYITQNIFQLKEAQKYKFVSGPFINKIFQIINIQQNKIKILLGDLKTTIKKKEFLFNPV